MAPDIISGKHQHSISFIYRSYHLPMPDPSPSTLTVYKLQATARKKEWWPQRTVHPRRLPVNTVIYTNLVGLEPTTFRLLVRRATSIVPPILHKTMTSSLSIKLRQKHWLEWPSKVTDCSDVKRVKMKTRHTFTTMCIPSSRRRETTFIELKDKRKIMRWNKVVITHKR